MKRMLENNNEVLLSMITKEMAFLLDAKERQEEAGASTEGFVFSMNDDPILYTSVTKAFTAYCKQIGIEVKSSHKARKTFVSTLLDADININSVRQFVGHKDEKTTLNNYCYDRSSDEERYKKNNKERDNITIISQV